MVLILAVALAHILYTVVPIPYPPVLQFTYCCAKWGNTGPATKRQPHRYIYMGKLESFMCSPQQTWKRSMISAANVLLSTEAPCLFYSKGLRGSLTLPHTYHPPALKESRFPPSQCTNLLELILFSFVFLLT